MCYLAVNKDGSEYIYYFKPKRGYRMYDEDYWITTDDNHPSIELPKGSIEKLLGYKLTWKDEVVEI